MSEWIIGFMIGAWFGITLAALIEMGRDINE